jgi:hypothetical protein
VSESSGSVRCLARPVVVLLALAGVVVAGLPPSPATASVPVVGTQVNAYGWGANPYGVLGDGTTVDRATPVAAGGMAGVRQVSTGESGFSVALLADGTVSTWGFNADGELGNGTPDSAPHLVPTPVPGLGSITAISAGWNHTLAVRSDGTVWAWGYNFYRVLGDGTQTNRPSPIEVPGLTGIIAVAAGQLFSLALRSDGTVWSWGHNGYAELGDGTTTNRPTPVQVSGLTGVVQISAGGRGGLALRSDGTVWSWGNNAAGQLGVGSTVPHYVPIQIPGLSGVTQIAAGYDHSLAVAGPDAALWAWGQNNNFDLGDGTTTQRLTPVRIGLTGVTQIAAGVYQSAAVLTDGTLWTWGYTAHPAVVYTQVPTQLTLPGQVAGGPASRAVQVSLSDFSGLVVGTSPTDRVQSCLQPPGPGLMACAVLRRTDIAAVQSMPAGSTPAGYGPADLGAAYHLARGQGSGATIAVVDPYNNAFVESDLATYRSQFGLGECSTANGCFTRVNQDGDPTPLPTGDDLMWDQEVSLDLEMVSAICPLCHILLVEANSIADADLFAAEDYATAHARYVSNSWSRTETPDDPRNDSHFDRPGVAITVATGDHGYAQGARYPATSPYVTAVGGTSLARSDGGFTETAWSDANSHCSAVEPKPSWQTATGNCALRADADVSAVADRYTPGVAVYSIHNGGWVVLGGTSAAAPIIAATYALAGTPGAMDYPASYPYTYRSYLHDVTSGSNGSCGAPMCDAGTGWDGPTGLGTPVTAVAFNPMSITVPDVSDLTQNAATQALQAAGLTVGNVSSTIVYDSSQGGRVVNQIPHAGTQTAAGTSVNLTMGVWSGVNR